MILFYSEFCQHCNVLLDTIKRFDKNNTIKLVSIDTLRSLKKTIDPKIHSVPALYLLDNKKYLFGKEVFDFLILKNKFSFAGENTRMDNKKLKDQSNSSISVVEATHEFPQAFSLGSISAESFSSFDDQNNMINDKNYKWDLITNDNQSIMPTDMQYDVKNTKEISVERENLLIQRESNIPDNMRSQSITEDKKLPTLEDIMKQRANDIL